MVMVISFVVVVMSHVLTAPVLIRFLTVLWDIVPPEAVPTIGGFVYVPVNIPSSLSASLHTFFFFGSSYPEPSTISCMVSQISNFSIFVHPFLFLYDLDLRDLCPDVFLNALLVLFYYAQSF